MCKNNVDVAIIVCTTPVSALRITHPSIVAKSGRLRRMTWVLKHDGRLTCCATESRLISAKHCTESLHAASPWSVADRQKTHWNPEIAQSVFIYRTPGLWSHAAVLHGPVLFRPRQSLQQHLIRESWHDTRLQNHLSPTQLAGHPNIQGALHVAEYATWQVGCQMILDSMLAHPSHPSEQHHIPLHICSCTGKDCKWLVALYSRILLCQCCRVNDVLQQMHWAFWRVCVLCGQIMGCQRIKSNFSIAQDSAGRATQKVSRCRGSQQDERWRYCLPFKILKSRMRFCQSKQAVASHVPAAIFRSISGLTYLTYAQ